MSADFVPPIKSILKTIDSAIDIARRVTESAVLTPADHGPLTPEFARDLHSGLEQSSKAIKDAYEQSFGICGDTFTRPLRENAAVRSQLKDLRIGLVVQIARCNDFDEEADLFDPKSFADMQYQVQKCSEQCISIFHEFRDAHAQSGNIISPATEATNRIRSATTEQPPDTDMRRQHPPTPSETPPRSAPVKPKSPWSIDGLSGFNLGASPSAPLPIPARPQLTPELSPASSPLQSGGQSSSWIPREIVHSQIDANREFLERRRQSRILFQKNLSPTIHPLERPRVRETLGEARMGEDTVPPISPVEGYRSRTSSSGYEPFVSRQRSHGQVSQATRSSRGSSIYNRHIQNRDSLEPTSPRASFASFSPVREPPRAPPNAAEVESGLEVVMQSDFRYDTEKMISSEATYTPPRLAASVRSIDHPMGHDASFYKYGGFCDGAKAMMRGELGFKVIIKPSGHYSTNMSAKCVSCAYEVGCTEIEKDRELHRDGIYGNSGIRWRQRFISKCHVKTTSIEEPVYACIFCVEEGRTVEEHDATVFFSVGTLFRHLAKHPRPLPNVVGITTLYGPQPPQTLDFDLHYLSMEPRLPEFSMASIATKVTTRPSATATATHRPKVSSRTARDPDGGESLQFAAGAKIVGITIPERFSGQWLCGYHDGRRGCFPSEKVALTMPAKEDILMNAQSSLSATARWDFKPKDAKGGGWLKFSKGDRISCIGYTFQDQWCWSGQSSKGKWGIFPSSFISDLQDTFGQEPLPLKSQSSWKSGGALGSIMSLGRKASKNHQRNSSLLSDGSLLSNGSAGESWRG